MWFWLKSKYWHVFTKMIWLELLTYWVSWNLILVGNRVIGLVFGSKTTAKVYQLFCQFPCTRVQRTIQSSITLCREDSSPWHPFCAGDIHSNLLPGRGRQTNRPSLQTNGHRGRHVVEHFMFQRCPFSSISLHCPCLYTYRLPQPNPSQGELIDSMPAKAIIPIWPPFVASQGVYSLRSCLGHGWHGQVGGINNESLAFL